MKFECWGVGGFTLVKTELFITPHFVLCCLLGVLYGIGMKIRGESFSFKVL